MKKIITAIFLIVLGGQIVRSQVPEKFNYQGVLRNSSGDLITNTDITIRMSILEGSASASATFMERHEVSTNSYGQFAIIIGNGTNQSGSVASVDWSSGSIYLKTEMEDDGGSTFTELSNVMLLTVPYALYAKNAENVDDADADPTNEMQHINLSGTDLSISNGNAVDLSVIQDGVDDADHDATNEIQDLDLDGDVLTITNNPDATEISLAPFTGNNTDEQELSLEGDTLFITNGNNVILPYDSTNWVINGSTMYYNQGNVGIGSSTPVSNLEVKSNTVGTDALFQVINANNDTVFAVYPDGVKVFVNPEAKGKIGGFAVSGRNPAKGNSVDIMRVTGDSTRFYVNETSTKRKIGGFAVSGRNPAKGTASDYLLVTGDSTRIYVNDTLDSKRKIGGFAVSGRNPAKGSINDYLKVTKDSTRIYIEDSGTKGKIGGFAVSGRNPAKGLETDYFNVSGNTTAENIANEARVMWYPKKAALLAGEVHVGSADSVGTNSTALGYRSVAMGEQSQSFGYQTQALGDYSTAIGKNARANNINSFAFGESAQAKNDESYAIGREAVAEGFRSFAFGSAGIDSAGTETAPAKALGDYSFAIGQGSISTGFGSIALGLENNSTGQYSIAAGYKSEALHYGSTAIGYTAEALGENGSTAIGYFAKAWGHNGSIAIGDYSFVSGDYRCIAIGGYATGDYGSIAIGSGSQATGIGSIAIGIAVSSGNSSTAIGSNTHAEGTHSTSFGANAYAKGDYSLAMGRETNAQGDYATAMGRYTEATGFNSFASGSSSIASGTISFSSGNSSVASGDLSVAFGNHVIAPSAIETVIGSYNTIYTPVDNQYFNSADRLFVIGNGENEASRSDALVLLKNGNLGLGTSTPSSLLHLSSAGDAELIIDADSDNSGEEDNPRLLLRQDGGSIYGSIGFIGTSGEIFSNSLSNSMYLINHGGFKLQLGTNNTADITINTAGDVGIGTTSPGEKLDVNGNLIINNYLYGSYGTIASSRDEWLRLNEGGSHTNGIYIQTDLRADGELRQGSTDYGGYEIQTSGQMYTNDYLVAMGGIHVGGSGDPGTDNLVVDGGTRLNGILYLNGSAPYMIFTETETIYNKKWYMGVDGKALFIRENSTAGSNERFVIEENGNIGLGVGDPRVRLDLEGSIYYTGSCTDVPDIKLKTNIRTIEDVLPKLNQLNGVYYHFKNTAKYGTAEQIGMIAQDMQKVFPQLVNEIEEDVLGINYIDFSAVLLQAIKEQQQIIENQDSKQEHFRIELENLKQENSELKQKLNEIIEMLQKE